MRVRWLTWIDPESFFIGFLMRDWRASHTHLTPLASGVFWSPAAMVHDGVSGSVRCGCPELRQAARAPVVTSRWRSQGPGSFCTFNFPLVHNLDRVLSFHRMTEDQVSPSRTPFFPFHNRIVVDIEHRLGPSAFLALPDSSNRVFQQRPSAHRLEKQRGPVGYASAQPEVSISGPRTGGNRVSTTVIVVDA